ncbi:Glycosyl transferase family 2 [Flavobacterium fluvii]|uniref:Glycosyl transferase family 2 n=1 Tax=Flavobacterium fluvii TaxID=468056 RepID=A0A1M5IR91_9FLAO|nr:glycosyltransferase [Flavobacterium fluvii]SHG30303.1 Glycosyl transferase family 2 [Flavobacterium fluvii]
MVKELNPLVSICIPTYNGEKYIEEALNSAIIQTYTNLEIIISDDASIDRTIEIINSYRNLSSIPFYIYHHIPDGIGSNWNNCVKKAKGKYIKFLFQDDVLLPTCVEQMVQLAVINDNVGMVYCKRKFIYDKNDNFSIEWIKWCGNLHSSWKSLSVREGIINGKECLKDEYLLYAPKNKFGEPTAVLINKKVFNKIGYFNENLKQTLDLEFWWRVLNCFDVGFIDKELVFFRLHRDQATQLNSNNQINELEKLSKFCYDKLFWRLHPKTRWNLFKSYGVLCKLYRKLKKI